MSIFEQPLIQNPPQNLKRKDTYDGGGSWDDDDDSADNDGGGDGGDGGD